MTSKKKDFFEAQGYRNIGKRVVVAVLILVVVGLMAGGYFWFFSVRVCESSECFYDAIENCDKVSFIREGKNADWKYEIIGEGFEKCNVEVELLEVNKGSIENEIFEGKKMICDFSGIGFPEEDIFSCSGVLREEIQESIIERMHNYLLENIGEVKEEFRSV
jgi:hypothetical protein